MPLQIHDSVCVLAIAGISGKEIMGYVASAMFVIYMALRIYKAYLDIKDRNEKNNK